MKIFLDVGAHNGETLEVVLEPKYGFDKIYCFEPALQCCNTIRAKYPDKRVYVCEYGLWNKDCTMSLYNHGEMGASVFKDKPRRHDKGSKDTRFVSASNWFSENLNFGNQIYLKLNCEGAECVILDDLVESGQYKKLMY